jgi:hypothetical protein
VRYNLSILVPFLNGLYFGVSVFFFSGDLVVGVLVFACLLLTAAACVRDEALPPPLDVNLSKSTLSRNWNSS